MRLVVVMSLTEAEGSWPKEARTPRKALNREMTKDSMKQHYKTTQSSKAALLESYNCDYY